MNYIDNKYVLDTKKEPIGSFNISWVGLGVASNLLRLAK